MTAAPDIRPAKTSDLFTSIDMRCAAVSGDTTPGTGRCQLLAGHDGPHAVMYADTVERRVLVWHGDAHPISGDDDWVRLPWMRGFPTPAWFTSGP